MIARFLAALVVVAVAVIAVVVAWPQLFGLQLATGLAQAVSLRGAGIAIAASALVLLVLVALASKRARRFVTSLALVTLAFCLVSLAVLTSRGFGDTSFETKGESDVTVLAWNTLGDLPGAATIAQLALDEGAQIVSLPETTEETGIEVAELMREGGSRMWVLTWPYDTVSKARSTTLLISPDLGEYTFSRDERITAVLPTIVAEPVDGTGPTIVAVHAVAPIQGQMRNWRADLASLAEVCQGDNVIMAGDFNSTIDHYAGLATTTGAALGNCFDAAQASGNAAVGTWPAEAPALLGAPIDHVMQTPNWRVSGMRVIDHFDDSASDHRPIVAQLSPAG